MTTTGGAAGKLQGNPKLRKTWVPIRTIVNESPNRKNGKDCREWAACARDVTSVLYTRHHRLLEQTTEDTVATSGRTHTVLPGCQGTLPKCTQTGCPQLRPPSHTGSIPVYPQMTSSPWWILCSTTIQLRLTVSITYRRRVRRSAPTWVWIMHPPTRGLGRRNFSVGHLVIH